MFRHWFLLLCLALPIAGCATPDTIGPVSYRSYDRGFQKMTMTSGGTFAGKKTEIYLRRLQNGGKLEICGFYIMSDGMSEDLMAEWLKYAQFTINEEEIVSSKFLRAQKKLQSAKANCVVTTTNYEKSLATGDISLKGRRVRLSY